MVAALADGHAQNAGRRVHQHASLRQGLLGARVLRIAERASLRGGDGVVAVAQATDRMVGRAHKGITPA